MTLYEMTEAAKTLYELFMNDEIPLEAVQDTLDGMGVENKLEDYVHVIIQLNADLAMLDKEIEKLLAKKARAQKSVDKTKAAALAYMYVTNKEKERAGVFSLSIRKSEAVNITDLEKLPSEYVKAKTTITPDKKAIKNAIKAGAEVAGAEIVENRSLQIK